VIKRARKKACLLQFIFDQRAAGVRQNLFAEFICWPERAGPVHTGGARAGNAPAEAFVSC